MSSTNLYEIDTGWSKIVEPDEQFFWLNRV
jgi:hypothetical protein